MSQYQDDFYLSQTNKFVSVYTSINYDEVVLFWKRTEFDCTTTVLSINSKFLSKMLKLKVLSKKDIVEQFMFTSVGKVFDRKNFNLVVSDIETFFKNSLSNKVVTIKKN